MNHAFFFCTLYLSWKEGFFDIKIEMNMENLEFVLGVLSTVGMFLVGYASIGVFKVKSNIADVNRDIDDVKTHIGELNNHLREELRDLNSDYQHQIDELRRQIDSRFDKFENRITKR